MGAVAHPGAHRERVGLANGQPTAATNRVTNTNVGALSHPGAEPTPVVVAHTEPTSDGGTKPSTYRDAELWANACAEPAPDAGAKPNTNPAPNAGPNFNTIHACARPSSDHSAKHGPNPGTELGSNSDAEHATHFGSELETNSGAVASPNASTKPDPYPGAEPGTNLCAERGAVAAADAEPIVTVADAKPDRGTRHPGARALQPNLHQLGGRGDGALHPPSCRSG